MRAAAYVPFDDTVGNGRFLVVRLRRERDLDDLALHTNSVAPRPLRVPTTDAESAGSRPTCQNAYVPADELTELAYAAANGDDVALRDLIVATQTRVNRLCAHLGSHADAEDLTQETYLRAVEALPRFRGDAPVIVWLLTIARRVCADNIRRRARRPRVEDLVVLCANAAGEPALEIHDLVRSLDDDRREAFVLTQVLGLSYEQAATICGCAVGTIRSRVARARATLVEAIREAEAS